MILSLKKELAEAKELLLAAERSGLGQALTPQTQQQISHLRSELKRARTALTELQVISHFYTSMKSWRGYIFTTVCVCVCSTLLVKKIPAEQMDQF